MKTTKQGVRDLNERGYNGHVARGRSHHCVFGPTEIIGWHDDDDDMSWYSTPIYGRRCLTCGEVAR